MKFFKYLLPIVGITLFLAACGGGGQNGQLKIDLQGPAEAPIQISNGAFNGTVTDGQVISLGAGSYTVTAGSVAGYSAPAAKPVVISVGATTPVSLVYVEDSSDGDNGGDQPTIETGFQVYVLPQEALDGATISVVNAAGDTVKSVPASATNPTEIATDPGADLRVVVSHDGWTGGVNNQWYDLAKGDVVRVEVTLARDGSARGSIAADGINFTFGDVDGNAFASRAEINPEKNAILVAAQTEEQVCVTVQVRDADGNAVRNAPVTVGSSDFFGNAVFYPGGCANELSSAASNGLGGLVTDGDGNVTFSLQGLNDFAATGPVKVLVSAVGEDNVAVAAEFKLFFVNMSHVSMVEGDRGLTLRTRESTETRLGFDYGTITNIFEVGDNGHTFGMVARTKQPTDGPFPVNSFGDGPNFVEYEIVEHDGDVQWVVGTGPFECNVVSTDGTVCHVYGDDDTSGATLEPVPGTTLADLPISATIKATFHYRVTYGNSDTPYSFPLKSYIVEKEWVGGFLEIDKYVDQHVLTWYGSAHTLASHDQAGLTNDNYLSTVHVTVENPSGSTIYNVAVRDSVPAELGVVTTSISDGGTYDPTNHAVTWNYTNVAELETIAPGDPPLTFTFDVYARQKPGFCWETAQSTVGYVVQPGQSGAGTITGTGEPRCYTDPYRVTNGLKYGSVNASGSFGASAGAAQHSFVYEPLDDESDIWVVRPLFTIDKTLMSSPTIVDGQTATFDVSIRNVDRTIAEPGYQSVAATYPWEFGNADTTTGPGHNADSSASRNNPYAHDVSVADLFETGLEFTDGSSFSLVNGGGGINIPGNVVDKVFNWNTIVDLPVGVSAEARVIFTGHYLPAFNEAEDGEDPYNEWENCVYLYAPQLNQPDNQVTGDELWQPEFGPVDGLSYPTTIRDCATVRVIPRPPTPFVTLTTNGEVGVYTDVTETTVVWNPELPDADTAADLVIPDMLRDGYTSGEVFYYILTVENPGLGDATNVMVTGALTNNRVLLNTALNSFAWDGVTDVSAGFTATTTNSFSFGPYDLDAGDKLVLAIPATSQSAGTVDLVTQLTYTNSPGWQTLPLEVTEETSIQP